MNFLNLETLQIEKSSFVEGNDIHLEIDPNCPFKKMQSLVNEAVSTIYRNKESSLPFNFKFNVVLIDDVDDPLKKEELMDMVECVANVVNSEVFSTITTDTLRKRERRLDIPENLKPFIYASLSAVKKMINYETHFTSFNVQIDFSFKTQGKVKTLAQYSLIEQNDKVLNSK